MRVLIVMPAQWPRALIRAALREAGYDALGAPNLDEALTYPADEVGRGPVRLILLDQQAVPEKDDQMLRRLLDRHPEAETVLLRGAFQRSIPGPWRDVVQHPVSIAELTERVHQMLPLSSSTAGPGWVSLQSHRRSREWMKPHAPCTAGTRPRPRNPYSQLAGGKR